MWADPEATPEATAEAAADTSGNFRIDIIPVEPVETEPDTADTAGTADTSTPSSDGAAGDAPASALPTGEPANDAAEPSTAGGNELDDAGLDTAVPYGPYDFFDEAYVECASAAGCYMEVESDGSVTLGEGFVIYVADGATVTSGDTTYTCVDPSSPFGCTIEVTAEGGAFDPDELVENPPGSDDDAASAAADNEPPTGDDSADTEEDDDDSADSADTASEDDDRGGEMFKKPADWVDCFSAEASSELCFSGTTDGYRAGAYMHLIFEAMMDEMQADVARRRAAVSRKLDRVEEPAPELEEICWLSLEEWVCEEFSIPHQCDVHSRYSAPGAEVLVCGDNHAWYCKDTLFGMTCGITVLEEGCRVNVGAGHCIQCTNGRDDCEAARWQEELVQNSGASPSVADAPAGPAASIIESAHMEEFCLTRDQEGMCVDRH